MWRHFSCGEICFVEIFFCCNLRCFLAKPVLSQSTFYAENFFSKCCPWRKNDKYLYENNCILTLTPTQFVPEIETYVRFSRNAVLFQLVGQRGILEIVFPIFNIDLWKCFHLVGFIVTSAKTEPTVK